MLNKAEQIKSIKLIKRYQMPSDWKRRSPSRDPALHSLACGLRPFATWLAESERRSNAQAPCSGAPLQSIL